MASGQDWAAGGAQAKGLRAEPRPRPGPVPSDPALLGQHEGPSPPPFSAAGTFPTYRPLKTTAEVSGQQLPPEHGPKVDQRNSRQFRSFL